MRRELVIDMTGSVIVAGMLYPYLLLCSMPVVTAAALTVVTLIALLAVDAGNHRGR